MEQLIMGCISWWDILLAASFPLQSSLAAVEQNLVKAMRLDNDVKALESRRRQMEKDNEDLQQKMKKVAFYILC